MPSTTQGDKAKGAGKGFSDGVLVGIMMVFMGIFLCGTVIGMIIGLPMIALGLLAPFIGALTGLAYIKGRCPYCGFEISANFSNSSVLCSSCCERVIIKDKMFYKEENP